MLFRKKIVRSCQYCEHSTQLNDTEVLCTKRGVVSVEHKCCRFVYDPCKRIPKKAKASDFSEFNAEDFSL